MEKTFSIYNLDTYSMNNTVFTKEAIQNAIKSAEKGSIYVYTDQDPNKDLELFDIKGVVQEMYLDEENNAVMVKANMIDRTYKPLDELYDNLMRAGAKVSFSCKPNFEACGDNVYLKYLNLEFKALPSKRAE